MARKADYEVVIRPKGRSPADEYEHKGKTWIEGRENSNYVIDLENHTSQRMMAIVSVDGVSVVDGNPASFDSHGYVLEPHGQISIPGWLIDNSNAAQFTFSKISESYARENGQDGNQGVIGVAWFAQKINLTMQMVVDSLYAMPMNSVLNDRSTKNWGTSTNSVASDNSLISSSMRSTSVASSIGTGFGEQQSFATTTTKFEKASSQPNHVTLIYYDSASNLIKRGIKLRERARNTNPDAFPGNSGFCAPPPGWVNQSWSKK